MNDLANFDKQLISCTLSQSEYKLLIVSLGLILELTDATNHPELSPTITEAIKAAFKQSGFKLDDRLVLNTAIVVDLLYTKLMDSYTVKRWEYIEQANNVLHDYAAEHFHPDIYDLPEGETLKVAEL